MTMGIPCLLAERNNDTTKWPKMDLTNARSMEILKKLGVAEGLRSVGVPGKYSFDVIFSTGLGDKGEALAKWNLMSPDEWHRHIKEVNDGSQPHEPPQRSSQAIFEAWLKPYIQTQDLIDSHYGVKFESLVEQDDGVLSTLVDQNGIKHTVKSQYVVAADGGGSKVRRELGISLVGGPVPGSMFLIHFKSRDLTRLHKYGQFWHIVMTSGAFVIAQDEKDTWTIHTVAPLDAKAEDLDPVETIQKALGGEHSPVPIEVDEILVTSFWRPNICLADTYISPKGRVFLAGDAAHQNIPAGGYGMNSAVGDSFDLAWKLAAVIKGYGGPHLLPSYEEERKPVAMRNIDRSGTHWQVHADYWGWSATSKGVIASDTPEGEALRRRIAEHVTTHDSENQDYGIELGYRYNGSSIVIAPGDGSEQPPFSYRQYIPSTWPGARPPHVYLKDGETSIFSVLGDGPEFSLVDFSSDARYISQFRPAFEAAGIPWKPVHLPAEDHARKIWERDCLLLRPDQHVAWRLDNGSDQLDPADILDVAIGKKVSPRRLPSDATALAEGQGFKAAIGNTVEDGDRTADDKYAAFQR